MTSIVLERFIDVYQGLNKDNLHQLRSIYCEDVQFVDALHQVDGLHNLETYFAHLYDNLLSSRFDIHEQYQAGNNAFVKWDMHFSHTKLAKQRTILVEGFTHLRIRDDRVCYHRDYADLGQMLYEHIPVLGRVIKVVKQRAQT